MAGTMNVFVMKGCPACAAQKKILGAIKTKVPIVYIDVHAMPAYADLHGVDRTPTLVGIKDGAVIFKKSGYQPPGEVARLIARLADA